MFTNITASYNNGDVLIEAACLSTDTKPTSGIANGSSCIEMDTGDKYMFDEAGGQWIKLGSGGGGQAEVWFTSNEYNDADSMRQFTLTNVGEIDHKTELLENGENYEVFLNGEQLPYYTSEQEEGYISKGWLDSDDSEVVTKGISVYEVSGEKYAVATYVDASTAPTSVEVSVKAK